MHLDAASWLGGGIATYGRSGFSVTMASDHGNDPPGDRPRGEHPRGDHSNYYPGTELGYPADRNRQNGASRTPDSGYRLKPTGSAGSGMSIPAPGGPDEEFRRSGERNRSRQRSARTASGQLRICKKCGEPLTGQFVRALDGTFHLDCFKCRVRRLIFSIFTV